MQTENFGLFKNTTTQKSLYQTTRQSGNILVITRIRSASENMMPQHHNLTVLLPQNPLSRGNAAMPNTSVLLMVLIFMRQTKKDTNTLAAEGVIFTLFSIFSLLVVLFCIMTKTHIHT